MQLQSYVALGLCLSLLSCSSDPALIDRDALSRACVVSAGCGVQQRPSVQGCIDFYFDVQVPAGLGRTHGEIYRCVLEAKGNCERVRACFGPGESCDKTYAGYCAGQRAVSCDLIDKRVYAQDCGLSGLRCATSANTFAAECHCDAGLARCEGGWALRCSGEQVQSEHCAASGKQCEGGRCVAPSGAKACEQPSARCEGEIAIRCDGEIELRTDCAALPVPHGCQLGGCVPRGGQCDDDFNRCSSEGMLEACLIGRWERFDCHALGFDTCLDQEHGANCTLLQ